MEQIINYRKNTKNEDPNWIDYLIVLMIIAGTGFEWCFNYNEMIFFWVFPLSLIIFIKRKQKFNIGYFVFMAFYLVWSLMQIDSQMTAQSALINFGIRLTIYYMAAISVRKLPDVIIKIMFWMCMVSVVMWLLCMSPSVRAFLRAAFKNVHPIGGFAEDFVRSNPGQTLIFYFLPDMFGITTYRNSGPFWEPGMFAVFINIALALQILRERKVTLQTLIFLTASISTMSTTSIACTLVIMSYYYINVERKFKSFFFLIAIGFGLMTFLNSDFGLAKIQGQASSEETYSRFGAIAYHLSILNKFPWSGKGFDSNNVFPLLSSPNGLSVIFVFLGIPFTIGYYCMLYSGIRNLCYTFNDKKILDIILLVLVFLIVVFSQDATMRHFYYFICMYGLKYFNSTTQTHVKAVRI